MSILTALAGIRQALEAAGLNPAADSKDDSLQVSGTGGFDSSFKVIFTGDVKPAPELVMDVEEFEAVVTIEVGETLDKEGASAARARAVANGEIVIRALIYGTVADCLVVRQENDSTITKRNKHLIWSGDFLVRYNA